MMQVKTLNRVVRSYPHGCVVGIFILKREKDLN